VTRHGFVEYVPEYRSVSHRVPSVIFVVELMRMVGKNGLEKILAKGNPDAQACEMWLPRQK
jgi:hypothetical protein